MGKKFFTGWPMWEKLCFVLACCIVVTVLLGAIKLVHTHWRLRKYTAVAEKEKKEQAIQRQMSMRRRHDEAPFGVRALEKGVEVEGVWISRPNTPDGKSRQSSDGSLALQHHPRMSGDADIDIEKQARRSHEQGFCSSAPASAKAPSLDFDRAASTERLPSNHSSRDSSPDPAIAKLPRSMYPPCSYTKYHNHPYTSRNSSREGSLDGLDAAQRASFQAIRRASTSNQDGSSGSDDSSNSANDTESIAASAPRLFTQPGPRSRHQSVDFEMMNNHRRSQVAESGQLTPRTKKGGQSGDWSGIPLQVSTDAGDHSSGRQKPVSASSLEGESPTNPFSTPKIEALPAAVRRSSMPNVTSFAQFCKTAPPSPQAESPRSSSQERGSGQWRQSEMQSLPTSVPDSPAVLSPPAILPKATASAPVTTQQDSSQPKRPSFEKRASQVVRGHGSGFEILAPGSLNPPAPAESPLERQRAAPPISLHNVYRPQSVGSGPPGRRLQKKRRPSIDSTTSSESGSGRSRNSAS